MSFNIKFDYRFDDANFFTAKRKAILEQAGNIWSSYIQDDFAPIPAEEILRFPINNSKREVILDKPIDDVIIFVSSVNLDSDSLTFGEGSFYAEFVNGSDRESRIKESDFEPWLGTIEFNTNAVNNFYFDSTPKTDNDIPPDKQDFLSLSLHEIGHILGIGTSDAFAKQIEEGKFVGKKSVLLNHVQPIPLDADQNHIEDGFSLDARGDALLDKSFTFGERNLPTNLDLAILADIGYSIVPYDHTEVYRFFRYDKGFHFYTADYNEQKVIRKLSEEKKLPYTYEGIAYDVLAQDKDTLTGEKIENSAPVYRFFNQVTGAHLYTMDENEKNYIRQNLDYYSFEDVVYYAFDSQPKNIETIPLYRMLNTQTGSHLFTTDTNEFNVLSQTQPQFQIEGNGGVTFYVLESLL